MTFERKNSDLEVALKEWMQLTPSERHSLVQELGSMAIESADSDKEFSVVCNRAANLLHLLSSKNIMLSFTDKK